MPVINNWTDIEGLRQNKANIIEVFKRKVGDVNTSLFFDNGFGISVIRTRYSYGGAGGLYELAVLSGNRYENQLCYSTHITNDVEGWLTAESVYAYAEAVAMLKPGTTIYDYL